MTKIWYQMKGECYIYHIITKLKQNDNPLTNYSHFSNPTPQMYIRTYRYVISYCFF